jgi:hypothetical protein
MTGIEKHADDRMLDDAGGIIVDISDVIGSYPDDIDSCSIKEMMSHGFPFSTFLISQPSWIYRRLDVGSGSFAFGKGTWIEYQGTFYHLEWDRLIIMIPTHCPNKRLLPWQRE